VNYFNYPYFTDNERFELLKYKEGKPMTEPVSKRPHKCPICEGTGRTSPNGNMSQYSSVVCHGCDGKGIVWG